MAKNIFTGASIFDSFHQLREDSNIPIDGYNWFRNIVNEKIKGVDRNQLRDQIISDPTRRRVRLFNGMLYMFFYNHPAEKSTLEFYDTFPLVLMLERKEDTFFGINFHYIPPRRRLSLFLQLQKWRARDRILVPYSTLIRDKRWKIFKSCFRRYKISRIQGNCINISAKDWPIAINLPVERFKKSTRSAIWNNTLREEMS